MERTSRPPRPTSLPALPRPSSLPRGIPSNTYNIQQKQSVITTISIKGQNDPASNSPDYNGNTVKTRPTSLFQSRIPNSVSKVATTIHPKSHLASSIPVPVKGNISKVSAESQREQSNYFQRPPSYPNKQIINKPPPWHSRSFNNSNIFNDSSDNENHNNGNYPITRSNSLPPLDKQSNPPTTKQQVQRSHSISPPLKKSNLHERQVSEIGDNGTRLLHGRNSTTVGLKVSILFLFGNLVVLCTLFLKYQILL